MTLNQYLATVGETQTSFARRIGMCRHTIHRFCNGTHWPKAMTAVAIYEATDGLVSMWNVEELRRIHQAKSSEELHDADC